MFFSPNTRYFFLKQPAVVHTHLPPTPCVLTSPLGGRIYPVSVPYSNSQSTSKTSVTLSLVMPAQGTLTNGTNTASTLEGGTPTPGYGSVPFISLRDFPLTFLLIFYTEVFVALLVGCFSRFLHLHPFKGCIHASLSGLIPVLNSSPC